MRASAAITIALLIGNTMGLPGFIPSVESPTFWSADVLDGNQVGMWISNDGKLAYDPIGDDTGLWWPYNRRWEGYVWGAGLWVGAIEAGDTNVTCGYDLISLRSEFGPADFDDPRTPSWDDPYDRVHIYGRTTLEYEWPLKNRFGGDSVISEQDSYLMFNDFDPDRHFTEDNRPLELVVVQQTYAWTGPLDEDIIFLIHHIINHSDDTLKDVRVGFCFDADLGNEALRHANDLVGFHRKFIDPENGDTLFLNLTYQYQTEPESGWIGPHGDGIPGVFCSMFLIPSPDGTWGDDPSKMTPVAQDTIWILDPNTPEVADTVYPGESIGMTAFQILTRDEIPATKRERYNAMVGLINWDPPPYYFENYDPFDEDTLGPGDKMYLQVTGPVVLYPYDTLNLSSAVFVAADSLAMFETARRALEIFNYEMGERSIQVPLGVDLQVRPSIVRDQTVIQYTLPGAGHVILEIYNVLGQPVARLIDGDRPIGSHDIQWFGKDDEDNILPQGIYFLKLKTLGRIMTRKLLLLK